MDLGRDIFVKIKSELFMVSKVGARQQDGRPADDPGAAARSQAARRQTAGHGGNRTSGGKDSNPVFGRQRIEYTAASGRGGSSRTRGGETSSGAG